MDFKSFMKRLPVPLNAQQQEAVQAAEGPVLLLAVPGSGKTTVLVARLGYMIIVRGIAPENILTVTYTVAATGDMRRRFAAFFGQELADRMEFRTINGICAKIIALCSRMLHRKPFQLVSDEKQAGAVLSRIYEKVEGQWPTEADLKEVRTQITYIKNMMLTGEEIEDFSRKQDSASGTLNIAEIYRCYNRWLRDNSLMDYDDQMVYALAMLRRSPGLLSMMQDQYRYICVDEAQDTSKIQHAILALLASRDRNLFMVGDEDQSIYGFRAAYPEALTGFEKQYPDGRVLLMEENFRSTRSIVDLADAFIRRNGHRHDKSMRTSRPEGIQVREIVLKGRRAQYTYLAKVAADCTGAPVNDGNPGRNRKTQTAVLYRNNDSAVPLADRLDREGIPFRIRSADLTFFTHRTVQDICAFIRLCLHPEDTESFLTIYYKANLYIKKEQAEAICRKSREKNAAVLDTAVAVFQARPGLALKNLKSLRTHLRNMRRERPETAIERIVKYIGYGEHLGDNPMADNRIFILRTIAMGTDSLQAFLDRLEELRNLFINGNRPTETVPSGTGSGIKESAAANSFILSTIHASKGLEYDSVYLMDVKDGILPEKGPDGKNGRREKNLPGAGNSLKGKKRLQAKNGLRTEDALETEMNLEEERRLFYVGITRARNRLQIFSTGEPSTFVDELFGRAKDTPDQDMPTAAGRRRKTIRPESNYSPLSGKHRATDEELQEFSDSLGQGCIVIHKKYGEGVITDLDAQRVRILFDDKEHLFSIRALCEGKLLRIMTN